MVDESDRSTVSSSSFARADVSLPHDGERLETGVPVVWDNTNEEVNNGSNESILRYRETANGLLLDDTYNYSMISRPASATTVSLSSSDESSGDSSSANSGALTKNIVNRKDPFSVIDMGDHIYKWCSFLGIPGAFQHHAIVMEVIPEDEDGPLRYQVADFGNWRPEEHGSGSSSTYPAAMLTSSMVPSTAIASSGSVVPSSCSTTGGSMKGALRTYVTDAKEWRKVRYEAGFWKRTFSWSGTSTSTMSDPPALVRARVQFLLEHPEAIPPYNTIFSNCECVALWCKTGEWTTLQAASWLSTSAAGQVKSAATLAATVSAVQVPVTSTVPAAGVMGWLGFTTQQTVQVSLLSTQPLLLPAIATYGVITVGIPAVSLALAFRHWKKMTKALNQQFWENAISHPDVFVECITHWSSHLGS